MLRFVDEEMLRLPGPGPWVSVKRFSLARQVSGIEALASLIGHPDYLDFYTGDHVEGRAQDGHGPYRIDALEVVKFTLVSPANALSEVRSWLGKLYEGQEPAGTSRSVLEWITPHLSTDPLYVLGSLSNADWHETGWVVGGSGFHEWVAVTEAGLELIVASDD